MGGPGVFINPVLVFVLAIPFVAGVGTAFFDIVESLAADLTGSFFPVQVRQGGGRFSSLSHMSDLITKAVLCSIRPVALWAPANGFPKWGFRTSWGICTPLQNYFPIWGRPEFTLST